MVAQRNIFVLISLSVALTGGCASTGEKMVQSFSRTRKTVNEAERQVDATIAAMVRLRSAPAEDLKDVFAKYKESVTQLDEQGKNARFRATAMKQEADAHIQAWQKEMETLEDPAIKSTLESRRQAVRANFQFVQMYADDARKAYEPFLKGNQQLVQAISIDLSPAALSSLAPAMERVASDGVALKQRLAAIQRALDNIANGVSPLGESR